MCPKEWRNVTHVQYIWKDKMIVNMQMKIIFKHVPDIIDFVAVVDVALKALPPLLVVPRLGDSTGNDFPCEFAAIL